MNDEAPDTCDDCGTDICPTCGSSDIESWDEPIERGPTNTTGTLAGKPTPKFEYQPATAYRCGNCDWAAHVPDQEGGR